MPSKVDWIALGVALLSFGLSGYVFYYTEYRGPDIHLAVGHDVLITKTTALGPRFAVTCSFTNEGARQSVITDAALDFDSPKITLPLSMVSNTFGDWEENNGVFKSSPTKFSLPVPIPIKAHGEAAAILWFVPSEKFDLKAIRHQVTIKVMSQEGTWERHFVLDVSQTDLKNMDATPYAEHPIRVEDQK